MNDDEVEARRRAMVEQINNKKADRATLEARYGKVWDTEELKDAFEVQGFLAPFVSVTRKADGKEGALMFQHMPRFYFNFQEV